MRFLKIDFSKVSVPKEEIKNSLDKLASTFLKIKEAITDSSYSSEFSFAHAPFDNKEINSILSLAQEKKKLNPEAIFLIGIGGSNLGALAIFRAIYGDYSNEFSSRKFYCADTIDDEINTKFLKIAKEILDTGKNIFLIIVSKSGTTLETLVNASLFINLLKCFKPDYEKFITIITDEKSSLQNYAEKNKISYLNIPKKVGGRYSVFSAAGLFPLAMLNIDIENFCQSSLDHSNIQFNLKEFSDQNKNINSKKSLDSNNLKESLNQNINLKDFFNFDINILEEAALSAAIIFYFWKNKVNIHNIFLFAPELRELGAWYSQLIGESLGKKFDLNNKVVEVGITPIVSIGTTDLHSVAQLYLSGPRDKFTTFINVNEPGSLKTNFVNINESNSLNSISMKVCEQDSLKKGFENPKLKDAKNSLGDNDLLPESLNNFLINDIKKGIFDGVLIAYENEKRPFVKIEFSSRDIKNLGEFMYFKMLETVYLGALLNINPFDQPQVELYKKEIRRILHL